jgi:hypothetical protein
MNKENAIPVIYYHSVGSHSKTKPWSFLSCDLLTFKLQMRALKFLGYKGCTWEELESHLNGTKRLSNKTVMIQFDDGFLDNWTVVFPLMEELNFKFSVVVTPEFIENHPARPFIKETTEKNIAEWWGYLSEEELLAMESSGLVDIQAHGYTHTWYPISDEIIDIYDGTQIEPWLLWNQHAEKKAQWLTNGSLQNIPLGYPIFKNEKSLSNLKAFKPNIEFVETCISLHDKSKSKEENLLVLNRLRANLHYSKNTGQYESDEETLQRLNKELLGTRTHLSKLLNKPIDYLVWPGGGNNEFVQNLAFECGYRLISKGDKLNSFNSQNNKISRVAAYKEFKPKIISPYLNVLFLQLQLLRASGSVFLDYLAKIIKKVIK